MVCLMLSAAIDSFMGLVHTAEAGCTHGLAGASVDAQLLHLLSQIRGVVRELAGLYEHTLGFLDLHTGARQTGEQAVLKSKHQGAGFVLDHAQAKTATHVKQASRARDAQHAGRSSGPWFLP